MRLRRSEIVVALGFWVFVLGAVVAPCLHQLNHRPDHVHDGNLQDHTNEPDAPPHHHRSSQGDEDQAARAEITDGLTGWAADRSAGTAPDGEFRRPLPGRHGHGALAHFGLAVPAVPVFLLPPPYSRAANLEAMAAPTARPSSRPRGLPEARGPPAA